MTLQSKRLINWTAALLLCGGSGAPALCQEAENSLHEEGYQEASDVVSKAPAPFNIGRTFGSSGLLAEFNSNENFGILQARLGGYRAHQASADAGGPQSGYRDELSNIVLPAKATIALPGTNGLWLVRAGGVAIYSRGASGNLTHTDTDTYTGQLQVLRVLGAKTVVAAGLFASDVSVDLRHVDGTLSSSSLGLQLDIMHKVNAQFGLSGRVIYDGVETTTEIPLASGAHLVTKTTSDRLFLEASAALTLTNSNTGFVPEGWRFRPVVTALYQRGAYEPSLNNFGGQNPAYNENFAQILMTARMESDEQRPWRPSPYFTLGSEVQLHNNISSVDDDPANIYARAGIAMNVGDKGRFDLFYARRDSLKGSYTANNFSAVLSLQF